MDKLTWAPMNPCDTCPASPKNDPQAYDGCEVAKTCVLYYKFISGKEYQKELLLYLIKTYSVKFLDIDGRTQEAISTWHLESMLKQLGV